MTKSAAKPRHPITRHRGPKTSDLFEQRIHWIHELLENSGAQVTWNDHVIDPDNPKQPRQIDVTIRRGQHLTLVECRIHKGPQNVKWIEELIGRRQSLAARSVIAVSASGFTKGAQRKAAAHGIALRDLRKLTDEEIVAWGQSIGITVICYQYYDVEVTLWFDDPTRVDIEEFRREFPQHPIKLTLFNRANQFLTDKQMLTEEQADAHPTFAITLAEVEGHELWLAGDRVRLLELKGSARVVRLALNCPRVEAYGPPADVAAEAVVEHFSLGETSIVHDRDRVAVLLDISTIELPPLCQFVGLKTDTGGRLVDFERLEFVGVDKLQVVRGPINVSIRALADYVPRHA